MVNTPDFQGRLLKAIFCEGEPDRVPMVEAGIALPIKERFLGYPITTLQDEISFWSTAGYDFIPLESGLRTIIDAAIHHEGTGRFDASHHEHPQVKAAKEYAIKRLHPLSLSTLNDQGVRRTWAPESKGFITTMEDFEEFPWPSPEDLDLEKFRQIPSMLPPGSGVLCFGGAIFSCLTLMMGMEECLISMSKGTELFTRLLQKVADFQIRTIEILLKIGTIGGLWINDDMGFKSRTLVNPALYRKYTFPYYREIKCLLEQKGLPLLLHSDGNITEILPDLVKIGFNGIHPIEPESMDIIQAREIVGPKVCLIGNLSLVHPLGLGTPEQVSEASKALIRSMAPGGGYCFSSGNSIPDYIPYENWIAMRNTALDVGVYPIV